MPTMKSSVDKKGMTSSLSADAAEFVPQFSASQLVCLATAGPSDTSLQRVKGDKPVSVTEVPGYLTSCYPFVSPEDAVRPQFPRHHFPQHYPYTAGLSPTLPMPVTPPIRFPAWQTVKPEFIGNLQTASYGSMSFDWLTSLPVDLSNVRGDGLLLTQPKMAMPVPSPTAPGLLLTSHPDSAALSSAWVMAMSSPVFLQQQSQQQQQNQQQLHTSLQPPQATVPAGPDKCLTSAPGSQAQKDKPKMMKGSTKKKQAKQEARPESPVLISRSTQTDLPPHIGNYTLEERAHPLYGRQSHKNQTSSVASTQYQADGWKAENEDSDSGYNSPMHKKNLVSNGVQAVPSKSHSDDNRLTDDMSGSKPWKNPHNISHKAVYEHRAADAAVLKLPVDNILSEDVLLDGKKKRRKKKDHREVSRSPRLLGSNTKLLSRSSSSVSSSGTKPDEDDEKIDLHSWTDFPPVSSRVAVPSASSRHLLKSPLNPEDRVPLTVERSAHEPPWSIKFSSADQLRSERHRSLSGDKDKHFIPDSNTPPESAWGRIGRSFRNSQTAGLGKELSLLISSTEQVPLLNSKTCYNDCTVVSDSKKVVGAESVSRSPLLHSNRNISVNRKSDAPRGDHKCETIASSLNQKAGSDAVKTYGDQKDHTSMLHCQNSPKYKSSSSAMSTSPSALPSPPLPNKSVPASATVSRNHLLSTTKVCTASQYKNDASSKPGQCRNSNSFPPSYPSSQPSIADGWPCLTSPATRAGTVHDNDARLIGDGVSDTKQHSDLKHTAGSVTLNQSVISSTSSPLPASPILLQSSSLMSSPVFPLAQIRPNLPGAAAAAALVNYHIPPPVAFHRAPSVLHGGGTAHSYSITTSMKSTERSMSVRTSNPVFLPRGAVSHMSHSVVLPCHNGSVSFTQPPPPPPPPHLNASSVSVSGYSEVVTYQSPVLYTSGIVSNSPYQHGQLDLQPAGDTATFASDSSLAARCYQMCEAPHSGTAPGSGTTHNPSSMSPAGGLISKLTVHDPTQQHKSTSEPNGPDSPDNTQHSESEGNKKRRRRRRRRHRSKQGEENTEDGGGESQVPGQVRSSCDGSEFVLHFEDVDEFPDLLTAASHGHAEDIGGHERSTLSGTSVTYSEILKSTWSKAGSQSRTQSLTGSCVSGDIDDEDNTSCHTGTTNESKRAKKRRKRREQANKAAEAELAEISLEQQWLKEVGLKKSSNHRATEGGPTGAGNAKMTPGLITNSYVINEAQRQTNGKRADRKSQQPIAFDIASMIDALQKKPATPTFSKPHVTSLTPRKDQAVAGTASLSLPGNLLDSSAPLVKRGKEREIGKTKKPSPLKKVILKEREERKRLMLLDEDPDAAPDIRTVGTSSGVGIVGGESELSQDALSNKSGETNSGDANEGAELSADFSPISQTSPISMSPASPGNSGVNSPITGSVGRDPVVMKIHSRRFREYCTQILDKEIDQCCTSLLQDLVKFQDRMYHKDPVKAKSKRRLVLGLREVAKHLKLKKIKCVVISPNLEKIQSKGGLDEALNNILNLCREQNVPFVFALGRRALGRACAKLVPVSVVGIFNYEGCESKYKSLISLTDAARSAYNEMVLAVEKEVAECPSMSSQTSSIGGVPGLFAAHMGHSRTPSGCSAISFTSSILSEPISENFPHAEPEVDSKGYEIVRDAAGNVVHPSGANSKGGIAPQDIDDGNEADTEDFGEARKKRRGRPVNSVRFGGIGVVNDGKDESLGKDKNSNAVGDNTDDVSERGTVGKLCRNISELTLTNEDNFILRGEPFAVTHKCHEDDNDDDDTCDDDGLGKTDIEGTCDESRSPRSSTWTTLSHIDSIHSQRYNLGDEILSHHSAQSHDSSVRGHSMAFGRSSRLSSSTLGAMAVDDDLHAEQVMDSDDKDDDVDDNVDDVANDEADDDDEQEEEEEEEEVEEEETSKRHHRVIDKERIKSWLESQNISAED